MNLRASLTNLAWFAVNGHGYYRYQAALSRMREVQETILARYLRRNEDTVIGRRHDFSRIRSVRDYQARVPLSSYDDYSTYVERIAAGEQHVLTREPVKLFELSSGTTRAAKWIPYTASLQAEFRRAVAPWIFDLFRRNPSLLGGPAYWSITPVVRRPTDKSAAIPVGFEEDSAYLGGVFKRLVDASLAVPGAVRHIQDVDLFRRLTLLFLLKSPELRLISVWHPTFLALLLAPLRSYWDELLGDIERGFRVLDPVINLPPDPRRARELSSIDPTDFFRLWPHLALISCWGDGHAEGHLAELRRLFPQAEIQSKGLIATEAFVSLPFREQKPLAVTSHFFEFLDSDGGAHLPWELEVGAVYSLVVTTGGGLYRYQLQDRVEVTGFLAQAPCLRFLGKEGRVSDLFGEKLSEGFVAEAIGRLLARVGIRPRFAMLAPETKDGTPRYLLFLEAADEPPPDFSPALEAALRENPHYAYCVQIGQLAPAQVLRVGGNAYDRYVARLSEHGQRLGDIKPSPLSPLSGWSDVFREVVPTAPSRGNRL